MRCIALQSGSNGNSIYVETETVRLLFDAGISGRRAEMRLAEFGIDIRDVDALLLSHDHRDHTCGAGVFQRKFGLPVYVTRRTLRACEGWLGRLSDVRDFTAGATLEFGNTRVHTCRTPHDGADGVTFVVESGGRRLGILTDLGHVYPDLQQLLPTLDAALLETNYDDVMLDEGPYPDFLKRRIRGWGGHLSNTEAARLVADCGTNLQWLGLGHLSGENNTPGLAMQTHQALHAGRCALRMASRDGAVELGQL